MTEADDAPTPRRTPSTWFALPEPIRRVFARFPLRTYTPNDLPQSAPRHRNTNLFYSFQRSNDQSPSCNPSCLKWQALLKFQNVAHEVRSSNNHASPSGSLPFILPAKNRPSSPITASKIPRWITNQGGREETLHPKEEAYMALVDHDIRNAWLYFLYLDQDNFKQVAWPLYCKSASSNILVQQALGRQLKSAARDELVKSFNLIDAGELYERAAKAFNALSTLLGNNDQFFGATQPGLFDASVFAYTHLLLDDEMDWHNPILADLLREHSNLVAHRDRVLSRYFTSEIPPQTSK